MDAEMMKELAIMESQIDQSRAEAFRLLWNAGDVYAVAMLECIIQTVEDQNPSKRLFGLLAEIGFFTVFAEKAKLKLAESAQVAD